MSGKRVEWSKVAIRRLNKVDAPLRARIRDAVVRFAATGYGDIKQLRGTTGEYRLRVGDWRVVFILADASSTIQVLRVGPRGDVYND